MPRTIIRTDQTPTPPATYSQAVAAGGLVFVSGTFPMHPATGQLVGTTIPEQTAQCLRNISAILQAAGTSLANAVSATVILLDPDDFAGMNEEWVKWVPRRSAGSARGADSRSHSEMKISVAMIAAL